MRMLTTQDSASLYRKLLSDFELGGRHHRTAGLQRFLGRWEELDHLSTNAVNWFLNCEHSIELGMGPLKLLKSGSYLKPIASESLEMRPMLVFASSSVRDSDGHPLLRTK